MAGILLRLLQKTGAPAAKIAGNSTGRVLAGTTIGAVAGGMSTDRDWETS